MNSYTFLSVSLKNMPRTRAKRLAEAIDIAEMQEGDVDLVLLPPDEGNGMLTDTEDGDEDWLPLEGERQALPKEVSGDIEVIPRDDDDDAATEEKAKPIKWRERNILNPTQKRGNVVDIKVSHPELCGLEPIELFRLLFDEEMKQLIITETLRYAQQKNNTLTFREEDLETFVGIILLTGYNRRPRQRQYWSKDDDIECNLVARSMSRNTFENIKRNLHFANNENLREGDKMAKVQPLYEQLNRTLMKFGCWEESLSVDEEMVPYYGHHSCKMAMRQKPIRFGYKLWVLATSSGYPCQFEIYQGKNVTPEKVEAGAPKGLGAGVVLRLLKCLPDATCHRVTFDNFFTSADLVRYLGGKGVRCTGTARDVRLQKPTFPSQKVIDKSNRGEYWTISNSDILAVKWKDNRAVTLATNYDTIEPVQSAQRWSREKKAVVAVPQPNLVQNYNRDMGGVDLLGSAVSQLRPMIHFKKFYGPLVINCFGVLRVAAWRLHRALGGKLDHLEFSRSLVRNLLSNPKVGPTPGPSGTVVVPKNSTHHLVKISEGRCKHCLKNTTFFCQTCRVRIHAKCSVAFHQ